MKRIVYGFAILAFCGAVVWACRAGYGLVVGVACAFLLPAFLVLRWIFRAGCEEFDVTLLG